MNKNLTIKFAQAVRYVFAGLRGVFTVADTTVFYAIPVPVRYRRF